MDFSKNIFKSKKIIFLLWVIIIFPGDFTAADSGWVTFTSFKNAHEMKVIDDTLYALTSGGLLTITDATEEGVAYNNQDGLGTNDLSDIIKDALGQKWIAGYGRLIRFETDNPQQFLFFDNDNNLLPLSKIVDEGDFLWVGTGIGLVLFSKLNDGGQIQDSYQLFGSLNPSPTVNDIMVKGDSIWLATSNGLAVADKSDYVLLKSPSSWRTLNLGTNPELESDAIENVVEQNNITYIATDKEIFRFDDPVFTPLGIGDTVEIHRMKLESDTIFVYYQNSGTALFGYIDNDTLFNLPLTGLTTPAYTGTNFNGQRWIGSDGIYYDQSGLYLEYPFTGLPGNDIADLTVNKDGIITANFQSIAPATLNDNKWDKYNFWIRTGLSKVISDSSGNPMIATIGNGLWIVRDGQLFNYDENNSTLRGNSDLPPAGLTYVYIPDMATDGRFFYAACYRAVNNYPVAIGDLSDLDNPDNWDSIGVSDGLTDNFAVSLDLLGQNVVVGSESDGVFLCHVGFNPFNTDKTCRHYTRENSLLISNSVRVVRFAPDGSFWVGTNFGLSRYDEGIDLFRDVNLPDNISSDITALEFDGRGNLWIGTIDGLAFRNAATGQINVFNTFNSDLPSNLIREITLDRRTGNVYIATDAGLVLIPSQTGEPTNDINQVMAFPNPFVIEDVNDILNFNFAADGVITIFSSAGERIADMNVNQGWDGKNQQGKDVASGVYLFLVKDVNGNIGSGKFLLVRK